MGEHEVRFLDMNRLHASIRPELDAAFATVVESGAFVGRSTSEPFERDFAAAHGRAAAAGCGSGTDALALALRAAGIGPGDVVVVPSMTFVATAEAVVHCGAEPVLADVDPDTLLLSPAAVDAVRSDRVTAVLPVHLYGHVVPFDHLESWRDDGLVVIEDAAQAHLATWRDRGIGEVGTAACFSFYPGKNLGALGDGGAVVSDDAELVERVRQLRDHGRSGKYRHDEIGWCSRLDGLQAALLQVKLRHLPAWTRARQNLADRYRSNLADRAPSELRLVPWEEGAVHHLLCVRVDAEQREVIAKGLANAGIGSGIHYPIALSDQPSMEPWARPCPASERAAAEVLSLPMDPLMAEAEVDQVCDVLCDLVGA